MAQWKRAGPITQMSMDRNHPLLHSRLSSVGRAWDCSGKRLGLDDFPTVAGSNPADETKSLKEANISAPVAQWIRRQTSNL